jgi:hypothetical protein
MLHVAALSSRKKKYTAPWHIPAVRKSQIRILAFTRISQKGSTNTSKGHSPYSKFQGWYWIVVGEASDLLLPCTLIAVKSGKEEIPVGFG